MEKIRKSENIKFVVKPEIKALLLKLSLIHDRSMTGVIEQLIKKEGKEYGLIESRE